MNPDNWQKKCIVEVFKVLKERYSTIFQIDLYLIQFYRCTKLNLDLFRESLILFQVTLKDKIESFSLVFRFSLKFQKNWSSHM